MVITKGTMSLQDRHDSITAHHRATSVTEHPTPEQHHQAELAGHHRHEYKYSTAQERFKAIAAEQGETSYQWTTAKERHDSIAGTFQL